MNVTNEMPWRRLAAGTDHDEPVAEHGRSPASAEAARQTPCFTPGTRIKTLRGDVDVADIRAGDRVLTRDSGYREVAWAGERRLVEADLVAHPALRPVVIEKDAFGPGCPSRRMMVSPQHQLLLGGVEAQLLFGSEEVLVPARTMLGRVGIGRGRVRDGVTYVHFMFESHEIVLGDDLWTESFQPNASSLDALLDDQKAEIYALFPELEAADDGPGRFTSARPALKGHEARVLTAA
ncbi:hypothetical protein ATO8_06786 [Roseivivax marinus]|uniref:Hedgehog/Intein (Hint) domain-containing protein n=1 Tax=Roseivivax marinus TaxID=1379903 RepID=W4HNL8_9RHOB|nr:Hint domain-containing protein [Roseivivax marinus]ETW13716.1 hypothetical protein ATO8_06786 [Roseivivax marinus]UMA65286.1 Hint domain-containing protein [Roseivivax marinus]